MEAKRDEFRSYLERSGAIQCLTQALMKLYETPEKPENAVPFICNIMSGNTSRAQSFSELDAAWNRIEALERELSALKRGDETEVSASVGSDIVETSVRSGEAEDRQSGILNEASFNEAYTTDIDSIMANDSRQSSVQSQTYPQLLMALENLQQDPDCNSKLKKYLTKDVIDQLKDVTTETYQSKLLDCIQSGLQITTDPIGIYAADAECYTAFARIFDPIIEDVFPNFISFSVQPDEEWGDPDSLQNPDLDPSMIGASRISAFRNLDGFPFHGKMTEDNYITIMNDVKRSLETPDFNVNELKGSFYSLASMDVETNKLLTDEQLLFDMGSAGEQVAGTARFWPTGRAVYVNHEHTFLIWINHEEQLEFTSIQLDGDLVKMYQRLIDSAKLLNEHLRFNRHHRLGWATFCPTHLGNTLHISISVILEKLSYDEDKLSEILRNHHLKLAERELFGEKTVYVIENTKRLGYTEINTVKEMIDGIAEIIAAEKSL